MSHLHTNDIDVAAFVEAAPTKPSFHAPAISHTPCITPGCRGVIHHLGELHVRMCDYCLDVLAGDVSIYMPPRRRVVEVENDEEWSSPCTEHDHSEHDEDAPTSPKRRDEVFTDGVVQAERDSAAVSAATPDVDAKVLCATCVNMTGYRCGCGKLCCYECVDAVGKCPSCDGDGEEV